MTKILVVDDEPQILRALRINLVARHYEVEVAADGSSALRQAARWHPDLVILDLGLPDIDGTDVIHGLRGWTRVPIVVLSGRADNQDKIDALDAGADDYVTKPFSIEELLARIRAVSRRAAVHDAAQDAEPVTVRIGEHVVDLAGKTVSGGLRLTPPPSGTSWRSCCAIPASSSRSATCSPRSGAARPSRRPTICASTWPSCARNSNPTPPTPPPSHHRTRHGLPLHPVGFSAVNDRARGSSPSTASTVRSASGSVTHCPAAVRALL
ncbi:hypothetical protein GCM10020001_099020 [Nonomuraea salmonea]